MQELAVPNSSCSSLVPRPLIGCEPEASNKSHLAPPHLHCIPAPQGPAARPPPPHHLPHPRGGGSSSSSSPVQQEPLCPSTHLQLRKLTNLEGKLVSQPAGQSSYLDTPVLNETGQHCFLVTYLKRGI